MKIRRIRPDEQKIDQWLSRCGLTEKKHQYARSLSSGEQQKVSMIRALIFDPELVMIDETLSNLDPENLELFENVIFDIQKKRKITWLLISHRLAHIYKCAMNCISCTGGLFWQAAANRRSCLRPETKESAGLWPTKS